MSAAPPRRLELPAAVNPRRLVWRYAVAVIGYHLLALLAFIPWFFSWTGVALMAIGVYLFGMLGINLGYHRLLAHRGFKCAKWLEHGLAILGICCLQDTPARWVAVHRRHHQYADQRPDPHSPLVNFLWGHVTWMLADNADLKRPGIYERYARDILRDRFYMWCERTFAHDWLVLLSWAAYFLGGFAASLLLGGRIAAAAQFGASLVLWGAIVRTVIVWHITWSVNSATHLWGYRNYDTPDASRNNWLIALLAVGEGWHNNHHADSRSAKHGHRRSEVDIVYLVIRFLGWLGVAHDIQMPHPRAVAGVNGRSVTRRANRRAG